MNRREWLIRAVVTPAVTVAGAVMGGILLDVWMAAGRFSSRHWADVADMKSLPEEGTIPLLPHRVALVCRREKIAALSLECTHLGCLVNPVDQGFYCPCHGSEFGPLGEVWSGPAPRNLDWLPVRLQGGRVWVRTGTRLAGAAWTKRSE